MPEYTVVKLHLTGLLAGMKTGETTRVHLREGTYTCCVTGAAYRVTYCADDRTVSAAQKAVDDVYAASEPCDTFHVAFMAAYHTAVSHGAGPQTAATIAGSAASLLPWCPFP